MCASFCRYRLNYGTSKYMAAGSTTPLRSEESWNLRPIPIPYHVRRNIRDLKKSLVDHPQAHCLHCQSLDLHQFQLQQEAYVNVPFLVLRELATFNNQSVEQKERRAGSFNNPSN
ncbi:hypothetical protein AVEN_125002-1 [Araneus ventricosus]|uniref:Uncharacterized protein n=1 Tax=Araneus ventricosus TaxID=182803 RepID=A0A4Y2EFS0_ARAVE|nr:hypothetical protein AVEN_125002-1 [Araneus ventricosus]